MSNITGDGGSFSSENHTGEEEVHQSQQQQQQHPLLGTIAATANGNGLNSQPQALQVKKKRNLPGTPDPTAEVIALSPTTLMATNRFVCEICNKGFQRDQNLQLHRRGHNLPWKLRQRTSTEVRKRVYICPETTCVHHNPSRALGDLTGIKKHFCRKHGEKKWKCDKCSKKYAVQSDWKAHTKICGTKEYKCDCGTIFSRRDSFITHRAFCDALVEENNKTSSGLMPTMGSNLQAHRVPELMMPIGTPSTADSPVGLSDFNNHDIKNPLKALPYDLMPTPLRSHTMAGSMLSTTTAATLFSSRTFPSGYHVLSDSTKMGQLAIGSADMSATALLQKAAQLGATATCGATAMTSSKTHRSFISEMAGPDQNSTIRPYGLYDGVQTHGMGVDGGGFVNQFFDTTMGESSGLSDIGMFPLTAGMLNNSGGGGGGSQGGSGGSRLSYGGGGSGDVMTVDFLGVGRARTVPAMGLHEKQQQQQQGMQFGGVGQQRLQELHPFQRQEQQLSYGQAAMEKALWDV
ncbi:zinc finger protein GAI-ASSOCIATED FACTOR 1-like [Phoenix dactylifera]|uniref:Protein EARLY HEADING DATE 2 n=1 Tax=Phoenix dactylifera TaxID=42345 RepID=A0A8B7CK07_PHODC|nr:zinc finger protein GAI-ASSOCIATED FACTOR 1-like [Phoenix dactylifera]